MSRPNKPTIVAAAVLGAALLAAPVPALAQAASSAPAGGSIRLGAAGPISGGSAAFGLQFKEGVEQAVQVLQTILQRSVAFDAYAPEALRRQQLAALREQHERKAG